MQTTGTALLAVNLCSPARVSMPAQDGRSVSGLLYFAAVSTDRRNQGCRQGTVDANPRLWSIYDFPEQGGYLGELISSGNDSSISGDTFGSSQSCRLLTVLMSRYSIRLPLAVRIANVVADSSRTYAVTVPEFVMVTRSAGSHGVGSLA